MSKLANQVALVTGAARGLGRAYALRIAGLGAHVAVLDKSLTSYTEFEAERRSMTAATTVDEITKLGVQSLGIEADVGDPDAVRAAVGQVESHCTAEDCARVVEFLATDLSDYVTGAVIPIDGGSTRWAG